MHTENNSQKNLVIIGGGFAGAALAKKLERRLPADWEIYLLSKTNYVTFNPLLPEVVGASVLPAHVEAPLRLILKRTRIRMVEVDHIDYKNKEVHYHNNENAQLRYDELVFCAGVAANTTMMSGLSEHGLPLKTVGDALHIRNSVIERLEQATIHPDEKRRKQLTQFVVIGGGFSGVEVAGELEDFLCAAQRYYKNVEKRHCKVTLIASTDRLLPELPESLSKKTYLYLEKRGINIQLNQRAQSIEAGKVILKSGEQVEGSLIICTIGNTTHHFYKDDALQLERGKILTNPDMSAKGIEHVWALGDCAVVKNAYDGKLSPPTAQFADRQGKQLAKNIVAKIKGEETKPFSYKPLGALASIGRNNAVAEIFGIHITGIIAFMAWRGVYFLKTPTLSRKVRLFLEWNWAMVFPPDVAHLGYERSIAEDPVKEEK